MKNIFILVCLAAFVGCTPEKKQEIQENLIVQAMTSGQWKVSKFTKDGTDITADYSSYTFKFNTNLTVDAINGGNLERTGNWNADANAQTITALFAGASSVPVANLNGTWKITNTSWTSVDANQTANGVPMSLRLDKL